MALQLLNQYNKGCEKHFVTLVLRRNIQINFIIIILPVVTFKGN